MKKTILIFLFVSFSFANLTIGIGAGYKQIFQHIIEQYNQIYHKHIIGIYGTFGTLIFRANEHIIDAIIGYKFGLKDYHENIIYDIGRDKMVILSKNSIKSLKELENILIAVPNPKYTGYGKAAEEAFKNLHLKIHSLIVSMMPQGINYMIMNQAQGAVANYSHAILLKKFKYFLIPVNSYKPIYISVAKVKNNPELNQFIKFLKTKRIKEYLKHYGL